jgi:hypothetical protein
VTIYYVTQTALNLPASVFQTLGLQTCIITPGCPYKKIKTQTGTEKNYEKTNQAENSQKQTVYWHLHLDLDLDLPSIQNCKKIILVV